MPVFNSALILQLIFIHPNPNTFNSPRRQCFSFPYELISYITAYPCSGEGLEKLQKACKYFYSKNKIIVTKKSIQQRNGFLCSWDRINERNFKFWLSRSFIFADNNPNGLSKNIYQCTLKSLFVEGQTLTMKEINLLLNGRKLNRVFLVNIKIEMEDNSNAEVC